jgi:hypothetical protein
MTVFRSRGKSARTEPVRITKALRWQLEAARQKSGRSLGDEIEVRLRSALRFKEAAGGMLLLHLDDGLLAHLEAAHAAHLNLAGDLEDAAIFIIRGYLWEQMRTDFYLEKVIPLLREPYRSGGMEMPVYQHRMRELGKNG